MKSPSLQKTLIIRSIVPLILVMSLCLAFYIHSSLKQYNASEFQTLKNLSFSSSHIIQSHLNNYFQESSTNLEKDLPASATDNIDLYFKSLLTSPYISALTLLDNHLSVVQHSGSNLVARLNPNQFIENDAVIITTKNERIFVTPIFKNVNAQKVRSHWLLITLNNEPAKQQLSNLILSSLLFALGLLALYLFLINRIANGMSKAIDNVNSQLFAIS